MSQRIASACPPAARTASAALWMVPGNFGLGTSDFAAITTLAPSRAARSAIARPMPREAPVMNAAFPCREDIALRLELEVPTMITAIATPSAALQRPLAPAQPSRQRQPRSGQRHE